MDKVWIKVARTPEVPILELHNVTIYGNPLTEHIKVTDGRVGISDALILPTSVTGWDIIKIGLRMLSKKIWRKL